MIHYILTGFTQEMGFRVFAYEGTGADKKIRIRFTVRADLALIRKYGIRIQELPLMCLEILERREACDEAAEIALERALTFTEDQMSRHSQESIAARDAAALKRKAPRRQPARVPGQPGEFNPYGETTPSPLKPLAQNW